MPITRAISIRQPYVDQIFRRTKRSVPHGAHEYSGASLAAYDRPTQASVVEMAIRKQDFYEGAAVYLLARGGSLDQIRCDPPFVVLNRSVAVLLKYSTKGRSPWGFTIMPDERAALHERSRIGVRVVIALVCGSDGVAAVELADFLRLVPQEERPVHVSCYRLHAEWYEVNGPSGKLDKKVPPSNWSRLLS